MPTPIPSDPVAAFSDEAARVVALAKAMKDGGLTELEIEDHRSPFLANGKIRLVRSATAIDADDVAKMLAGAQQNPATAELARRVADANAKVSDMDILLNPMAGLEGATSVPGGLTGHG